MNKLINFFFKPLIQIISIAFITFFVIISAHLKLNQSIFSDLVSKIEEIDSALKIDVGLNLQNFIAFSIIENDFIADVNLWFEFDPKKISLKEIENFSFSKGEILEKSEPVIQLKPNGKEFVRYDLRLRFSSNLNYRYFPLEDHKIYITLNNKNIDAQKVGFTSNFENIVVSESLYTPGWIPLNASVVTGSRKIILGGGNEFIYPRVVFSIKFMQANLRYFIFIFLPIFIAFLIALCAFAISWRRDFSTIIGLTSASLAALVGYRYVIEKISPKVSYYMLSDHIFVFLLILLFAIFFIDIFFRDFLEKHKNFRSIIVLSLYIIFIFGWLYLLFIW